ncbi:unnamed protein product [Cuscuta epithymum]|uniref:Uncharacterized protein n=1 Tax=Cuscuta epithymum TaxID=186058 RepID=A0AAV0C6Z1_9ASTE|nr:unnamed protein product [Cuscuta epithymum]
MCAAHPESLEHIFFYPGRQTTKINGEWSAGNGLPFLEQINKEFQSKRKEALEVLVWGCWAIWCERNHRVWQGLFSSARQLTFRAQALVDGWKQAQQPRSTWQQQAQQGSLSWRKPTHGMLKLNVDAAVRAKG